MSVLRAAALAAIFSLNSLSAEVDFTPRYSKPAPDSRQNSRLYFKQGETKIGCLLPSEAKVSGGAAELKLQFEWSTGSYVVFRPSTFDSKQPFSGDALKSYQAEAMKVAPADATDVSVVEVPNPESINDWTGHEFQIKYTHFGRKMEISVIFLNIYKGDQIMIVSAFPAKDFTRGRSDVHLFLNSWFDFTEENFDT